jgi:hypothetical protein
MASNDVGVLADGVSARDIAGAIAAALLRNPLSMRAGLATLAGRFDLEAGVATPLLQSLMPSAVRGSSGG